MNEQERRQRAEWAWWGMMICAVGAAAVLVLAVLLIVNTR